MTTRALSFAVLVCAAATTPIATASGPDRPSSGQRPAISSQQVSGQRPATSSQQLLNEGDRAALAGDGVTAIAKYRLILADDPRNAPVHYRVGQAQAKKGELNEAEQAYLVALRFSGTDDALRAKILFCIADLRERQREYEAAVEAWTEYEKQGVKAPSATPYVGTAAERKNRVAEWKRTLSAAVEIKARGERRVRELDEPARKKAK